MSRKRVAEVIGIEVSNDPRDRSDPTAGMRSDNGPITTAFWKLVSAASRVAYDESNLSLDSSQALIAAVLADVCEDLDKGLLMGRLDRDYRQAKAYLFNVTRDDAHGVTSLSNELGTDLTALRKKVEELEARLPSLRRDTILNIPNGRRLFDLIKLQRAYLRSFGRTLIQESAYCEQPLSTLLTSAAHSLDTRILSPTDFRELQEICDTLLQLLTSARHKKYRSSAVNLDRILPHIPREKLVPIWLTLLVDEIDKARAEGFVVDTDLLQQIFALRDSLRGAFARILCLIAPLRGEFKDRLQKFFPVEEHQGEWNLLMQEDLSKAAISAMPLAEKAVLLKEIVNARRLRRQSAKRWRAAEERLFMRIADLPYTEQSSELLRFAALKAERYQTAKLPREARLEYFERKRRQISAVRVREFRRWRRCTELQRKLESVSPEEQQAMLAYLAYVERRDAQLALLNPSERRAMRKRLKSEFARASRLAENK